MSDDSCLTKRLSAHIDLTENERSFLLSIEQDSRELRKGDRLPIGERGCEIGVLDKGWAVALNHRHRLERITQVYLPGDLVGLAELGGTFEGQILRMQTDGRFCPFPRSEITRLISDLPRLAALFLTISGLDQLTLRDRVAADRALEAPERLAFFLLELRARLALPNVGSGNRFRLPMTQVEIGLVIGASDITVNKALRSVIERGWIEHERPYVRLVDRPAMEERVQFIDRYGRVGSGWFPPAG